MADCLGIKRTYNIGISRFIVACSARIIQLCRQPAAFGRRCRVIPRVPWWLENPVSKHPDIVFDQNLTEIDQNPIRHMLFLAALGTSDVTGTSSVSNSMFCVEF